MNLIEFLRKATIEDLGLPAQILQKLREQKLTEFQKIYASVQSYRAFGKCSIEGMTDEEMQVLNQKYIDLMVANGLMKPKNPPVPATTKTNSSTTKTARPAASGPRQMSESKQPGVEETARLVKRYVPDENPPASPSSPLATWENRLAPQLRKVELVGEIPISKEELDDISLHFSRLFYDHSTDEVLNFIGRNYPATFLVFMVGQGLFGYNNGDFWSAYEQVLRHSIDSVAFGRLFEKIIQRFERPQFRDLQERARRYVDPILAHGGIPVYCLKDFFSNIVLNCTIRPQLFALEGEELVEEVIKHTTSTANTDKQV